MQVARIWCPRTEVSLKHRGSPGLAVFSALLMGDGRVSRATYSSGRETAFIYPERPAVERDHGEPILFLLLLE